MAGMTIHHHAPTNCGPQCDEDRGYQLHRWRGEDTCQRSKAAHAAHQRTVRGPRRPSKPVPEHGTRARYERERKAWRAGTGPEPCEACKRANADRVAGRST